MPLGRINMLMSGPVDMIAERLAALETQMASLELGLKALREERDELLVAVRVIRRFSGEEREIAVAMVIGDQKKGPSASLDEDARIERGERATQRAEKTTPQMILEILADHEVMNSKQLLEEVQKRYWPDAPSSSVGPTAWRMWKDGRLTKGDAGYSLPNEERPAVSPADPSERSNTGGNGSLF